MTAHLFPRGSFTRRSLVAAAILVSWAAPAVAQNGDAALAESLFRDGKRLSAEHKYAEACPKFAESYRLDPGLGTLLNLATCHEAEGKVASAWAEFSEATARAKREGDSEREQLANEHVRALDPKLARIAFNMPVGAAQPGLLIKFDSRELSSAALGVQFPVDPGKHLIEMTAPGKQAYSQTLDAPPPGSAVVITVPALQDAAGAAAPPPPAAGALPGPSPSPQPAQPVPSSAHSHTAVIVAGVATGAFVVGAAVTGLLYSQKRSDFNSANNSNDASRFDKRDQASSMSTVNLVLTGGAIASAGLLVYFLVTQSSHEAPPATAQLQLRPALSPTAAGLTLQGTL